MNSTLTAPQRDLDSAALAARKACTTMHTESFQFSLNDLLRLAAGHGGHEKGESSKLIEGDYTLRHVCFSLG